MQNSNSSFWQIFPPFGCLAEEEGQEEEKEGGGGRRRRWCNAGGGGHLLSPPPPPPPPPPLPSVSLSFPSPSPLFRTSKARRGGIEEGLADPLRKTAR